MKTIFNLGCVVIFLTLTACGQSNGGSYSSNATATTDTGKTGSVIIKIQSGAMGLGTAAFGANPLSIKAGTTITWVNSDAAPHTATSDIGLWDSGQINPGGTFSFTFRQTGTYPYHCNIHGKTSMSGTIVVNN